MTETEKKVLVVAHGDLDGIVSAVLEMKRSGLQLGTTEISFTQPYLVDKVEVAEAIQEIYIVDIAVNNRDPEMTKKFIDKIRDKLVYWVDHHQGWLPVLSQFHEQRRKFSIYEDSESAARIIAAESSFPADFPVEELVSDANAADTRRGKLSKNGRLIEEAMKADLRNDSIREFAVRWIVNGYEEDEDYEKLQEAQARYQKVQAETEKLVERYKVRDDVAVLDVRDVSDDYDRTQLLVRGEQMAPTKTAVLLGKNPEGEEIITVATMDKAMNLVNLFGLPSGSPFRVSFPVASGWTVEKVLKALSH